MTEINAIYRFTAVTPADIEKITRMSTNELLPAVWFNETCVLSHSKQLFCNNDNTLVIVLDGEIYNIPELRKDLLSKGEVLQTNMQHEVIAHLYGIYGIKCLDYLRGYFAMCIYDELKNKMYVARDRMGESTLYYAQIPTGIVVSTELKNILNEYIPSPQINIKSLLEPIRYIAPLDMEKTWVNQIRRIQHGHYLEIDVDGIVGCQYWKRNHEPQFVGDKKDALEKTLDLMQESVDLTLRSDKPIAIMLSGGVDSCAVAALAKRSGHEVHTITVGFGGNVEYDERSIARRLANEQGFDYNEVVLNPEDYIAAFEELSHHIDEPMTDSAVMAQWVMYKKVKELGYDVVLSGMGGDELFYNYAGYNHLADARKLHHQFNKICPIDTFEKKKQWIKMMRANWKALIMPQTWHLTDESSYIPWYNEPYQKFISDAILEYNGNVYCLKDYTPHHQFHECPIGSELDQAYDDAIDRVMVGAYLYLGGKVAKANGIEVRCPLIDNKLVDFVMHLPIDLKGRNKEFMKEMLRGILPDYILDGKKRGFTPVSNYPKMIADTHKYKYIHSTNPFYPVALADHMLSLLLK